MTFDQKKRHSEFNRLFALMPGKNNAERLRKVVMHTGLRPNTVRQYRMADPPSFPSWQVIKLLQYSLGQA